MSDDKETPTGSSAHTPDFELPRHDAIREDNWPEYQAKGFRPVDNVEEGDPTNLDYAQSVYGVEHVYTGDAYSYADERPLRHKPGMSIYVTPEGMKRATERAPPPAWCLVCPLVAKAAVQPWCSAATVLPGAPISDPTVIRAASRSAYGVDRAEIEADLHELFVGRRQSASDDLSPRRRGSGSAG